MNGLGHENTLLIGIGNEYRRDDGVGLLIARRLRERNLPVTDVLEALGMNMALLETWQAAERVLVFDAVNASGQVGTVYRLDALSQAIPTDFFPYSSHGLGLAEAVELARLLDRLPSQLIIYGIEGADFGLGVGLTPAVERAAYQVIECISK